VASFFLAAEGHLHGADLADKQPAKLAALEAHWETSARAPVYLFAWPDEKRATNRIAIGPIPGMLSLLAYHRPDAVVKGLRDFPADERPPVLITAYAFRAMVTLGVLFCALALYGWLKRDRLPEQTYYLRALLACLPLPFLACGTGWIVAEVGRQPWIVYGLLRTEVAASPVAASQVLVSLIAFVVVYGVLGLLGYCLMARAVKRGPALE
jgi:cytochrome d ubiquinol oxidase subunit I